MHKKIRKSIINTSTTEFAKEITRNITRKITREFIKKIPQKKSQTKIHKRPTHNNRKNSRNIKTQKPTTQAGQQIKTARAQYKTYVKNRQTATTQHIIVAKQKKIKPNTY